MATYTMGLKTAGTTIAGTTKSKRPSPTSAVTTKLSSITNGIYFRLNVSMYINVTLHNIIWKMNVYQYVALEA